MWRKEEDRFIEVCHLQTVQAWMASLKSRGSRRPVKAFCSSLNGPFRTGRYIATSATERDHKLCQTVVPIVTESFANQGTARPYERLKRWRELIFAFTLPLSKGEQ